MNHHEHEGHGDHGGHQHMVQDGGAELVLESRHGGHGGHGEHGGHGGHGGGMMMYFHGGYTETILFESWRIESVGGLIGSMIACFLMGIAYEGLKFARDHVLRSSGFKSSPRASRSPSSTVSTLNGTDGDVAVGAVNAGDSRAIEEAPVQDQGPQVGFVKIVETSMLSRGHLLLTALQLLQVTLAYFLMLIAMTYNTWLFLAVLAGATAGYFLFGWRKNAIVDDMSDHCQ